MNVAQTIEALGGTSAVAQALGVVPSAVRNWRRLNTFPPRLHISITSLARERGFAISESLFRELSGAERAA